MHPAVRSIQPRSSPCFMPDGFLVPLLFEEEKPEETDRIERRKQEQREREEAVRKARERARRESAQAVERRRAN